MRREDQERTRDALVREFNRWREVEELAPGPKLRVEAQRAASRCVQQLELLGRDHGVRCARR